MYSVQCTGAGRCPAVTEDRRLFSGVREGVAQGGTFANMWRTLLSIEDYREAACDDKAVTMVYRSLVVSAVHCRWRNCARAGGSRGSGGQAGDQDTATPTLLHHTQVSTSHTALTRLYLHTPSVQWKK